MRRTTNALIAVGLLAATAACGSGGGDKTAAATAPAPAAASTGSAGTPAPAATAPSKAAAPVARDSAAIAARIAEKVHSAKTVKSFTAEDDPNHLLGRPHQYTSKTLLADARIEDGGTGDGIDRGCVVEVFAGPEDAKARAAYIEAVTKGLPAFTEYDFVHGNVLVRVAKALTPAQASEYDKAAA